MSVKTLLLQATDFFVFIQNSAFCFFRQALGGQPDEAVDAQSRIKPPTPSALHCLDPQQQVLFKTWFQVHLAKDGNESLELSYLRQDSATKLWIWTRHWESVRVRVAQGRTLHFSAD